MCLMSALLSEKIASAKFTKLKIPRQEKASDFGISSPWGGRIFPLPKMVPENPNKVPKDDKKIFVIPLEPFELIHVVFFSK